jgi:hypothetical protein
MAISKTTGLWTPDDLRDLLMVSLGQEYSEDDLNCMMAVNQAGNDWLSGKLTLDEYLGCLEVAKIHDPYELLDNFAVGIESATGTI